METADFKLLIGLLASVAVASTLLATFELRRMLKYQTELMKEAGIKRVDWWFRCIAGVYLLAFSSLRNRLSLRQRALFAVLCLVYPLGILVMLISSWRAG